MINQASVQTAATTVVADVRAALIAITTTVALAAQMRNVLDRKSAADSTITTISFVQILHIMVSSLHIHHKYFTGLLLGLFFVFEICVRLNSNKEYLVMNFIK